MAEEGTYQLTFKADGEDAEIKDTEDVLNEDKKSYKFLTKDGDAKATFANGDTFSGTYVNKMRNGQGHYVFKKQEGWSGDASYEGQYKDDKKHGTGTFTYPNGSAYTGQWQDDERHGQGKYIYPSGDVFVGSFKNGKKHGPGIYAYAAKSPPPLRLLAAAPAGVVDKITKECGVTALSVDALIQNEIKANTAVGKEAKAYIESKTSIPSSLKLTLLVEATNNATSGWVISGFPCNVSDAEQLKKAGIVSDAYLQVGAEAKGAVGLRSFYGARFFTSTEANVETTLVKILASSRIEGKWNEGKLAAGTWRLYSGSSYVGKLEANGTPSGDGVFQMAGGNAVRGTYKKTLVPDEDNEGKMKEAGSPVWQSTNLSTRPPTDRIHRLRRMIRRAKLRVDQTPKLQKPDVETVPGVNNCTMMDDAPPKVYGFGMPTLEGYKEILKKAKAEDVAKMFLIVTRPDPVCYLPTADGETRSYSPCSLVNASVDINMTSNDGKDAEAAAAVFKELEMDWVARVAADAKSNFVFYELEPSTASFEKKEAKVENSPAMALTASRDAEAGVELKSVLAGFAATEDEALVPLEYAHVPLPDQGGPTPVAIQSLLKVIKERDFATEAVSFANRTGYGAVQFGMAVAGLVHLAKNPPAEEEPAAEAPPAEEAKAEEGEEKEKEGAEGAEEAKKEEKEEEKPADLSKGEYKAIMDIVAGVKEGKGTALKADVDATIARCNAALDILACITTHKKSFDEAKTAEAKNNALGLGRKSLERYAMLLLTYIFVKEKLADDEATFDGWLKDPEQAGMAAALASIAQFNWS